MPRGDRTGPMGQGPITGCAAGYCAGLNVPGFANRIFYRAFNRYGGGHGYRNVFYATGLPGWLRFMGAANWKGEAVHEESATQQEIEALQMQAQALKNELDAVQNRLDEIRKEKKD